MSEKPIWQETEMGKTAIKCKEIVEMFGGKVDANAKGIELIAYFCWAVDVHPHVSLTKIEKVVPNDT